MDWRVACDFDGTITREDVTDHLLERFAGPEWREIEADWKAGLIGSRECMARQIDLLRATPEAIDRHLESVTIDPAFPAFVAFCRARHVPLTVVSDGLDRAIHAVLKRHGLGHLAVVANHIEPVTGDRWRLTSPHAREDCQSASGTCKCAILTRGPASGAANKPASGVVNKPASGAVNKPASGAANKRASGAVPRLNLLIGDGASDFCAAASADLVFAKDGLLRHAEHRALPHVAFGDFASARRLLSSLLDQPMPLPARVAAWREEIVTNV